MLRGDYVVLRAPEADDAEIITAWQNDRDVTKFLPFSYPKSKKDQLCLINKSSLDNSILYFIIENEDQVPIGLCSLKNIDWTNSTAEINVALYAKNCWGRGYGYDTVKTLTNFGLYEINLYTIYGNILDDNERAIKCFQKAGFEVEGVLFSRLYRDGRRRNLVSMSISKDRKQEG